MKTLVYILILLLGVTSSCKQSHDVVGNGLLQKRKYRSGWHLAAGKPSDQSIPHSRALNDKSVTETRPQKGEASVKRKQAIAPADSKKTQPTEKPKPELALVVKRKELNKQPRALKPNERGRIRHNDLEQKKNTLLLMGLGLLLSSLLMAFLAAVAILTGIGLILFFLFISVWLAFLIATGVHGLEYILSLNGQGFLTDEIKSKLKKANKWVGIANLIALGITILLTVALVVIVILILATVTAFVDLFVLLVLLGFIAGALFSLMSLILSLISTISLALLLTYFDYSRIFK